MKLSIMREFVHLCETKNFSKTAEELYIAQSALSRHIAALEKEVRTQLILRTKNSFQLTEAGELVKKHFQTMLEEYQDMLYGIAALEPNHKGELRLGVLYYDINSYVADIRETFHRLYPNITLKLYSFQPQELEEHLFSGKLDAGILYSVTESLCDEISYMSFLKIPVQVMFSKKHPLAAKSAISISDLTDERILWPEKKMKICRTDLCIDRLFAEKGITLSQKIPLYNYDEVPFILNDTGAVYIAPMANTAAYDDVIASKDMEPDFLCEDISVVWLKKNKKDTINCLCNTIKITYS